MADTPMVDATSSAATGPNAREADRRALALSREGLTVQLGAAPSAAPASPPTSAAAGSPPAAAEGEGSPPKPGDAVPAVPAATTPRLVSLSDEKTGTPAKSDAPSPPDEAEARAQRWLQMHGGDATRAHAKALENNNRMAEMARELEEAKQKLAGKADTPDEPAAGSPAAAEAAAAEEPPSQEDIEAAVKEQALGDAECRIWANDWQSKKAEVEKLIKFNENGLPVGGEILDLDRQIQTLKGQIKPSDVGLDLPEPDVVTLSDLQDRLDKAESKLERKLNQKLRLEAEMASLDQRYRTKTAQYRDAINRQYAQQSAEKRSEQVRAGASKEFNVAWNEAFKEVSKGYDKEDAAYLERQLQREAHALFSTPDGDILPTQLLSWMRKHEEESRGFRDRGAGRQAAETARLKDRDTAQPAPPAKNAIAPEPPASSASASARDRRRAADQRASQRARSIAVR